MAEKVIILNFDLGSELSSQHDLVNNFKTLVVGLDGS